MGRIEVPYLVLIRGRYRWQPGRHLRSLGLRSCDLGVDMAEAVKQAQLLNQAAADMRSGKRQDPPARPNTVEFWLDAYMISPEWKRLAPKTKHNYDQCAAAVKKWAGDQKPASITKKVIRAWYRTMYDQAPAQANARIRFLRLWMEWLCREGELQSNPAARPGLIGTAPRQQIWTEQQVIAFVSAAEAANQPAAGLAVLLGYHLGQRQGDILRLTWSSWDGAAFKIKQRKTGAFIEVPATAVLRTALETAARTGVQILIRKGSAKPGKVGKAFKEDYFRYLFSEIRAQAGIPSDLQFMDLRRTAVVRLARAGCTVPEIASITGHTLKSVQNILEVYLPRDGHMASAAIHKLERKEAKSLANSG